MSAAASLIALGYAGYLLRAAWTGALYVYIHPIYIWPAVATGFVLLGLVALGAWGRVGTGRLEDAGLRTLHPPGGPDRPSRLLLGLLALPLVLGFGLPPEPLSTLAAGQRGIDVTGGAGAEPLGADAASPFALGARPEAFTIKDWVKAFQVDPEPERHAGQPVRVTGFIHRDERLPSGWFLIARFVVKCCAVDAQPVGLPVRAGAHLPESGRWVTVEGAWEVVEVGGDRRAVIGAAAVTPVARPEQPYLY